MSDNFTPNDRKWLIILGALVLLLIAISTYQFWPSFLHIFNWPG